MRRTCYVCQREIDGAPVVVGGPGAKGDGIVYPDGIYRHVRCVPGSKRWAAATRIAIRSMPHKYAERARWWLRAFGYGRRASS